MKHRKLRIAWSAAWGILAALSILLCVRSYTWLDDISYSIGNGAVEIAQSNSGTLYAGYYSPWVTQSGWRWRTLGHAPRPAAFGGAFSNAEVSVRCPYWFLTPAFA